MKTLQNIFSIFASSSKLFAIALTSPPLYLDNIIHNTTQTHVKLPLDKIKYIYNSITKKFCFSVHTLPSSSNNDVSLFFNFLSIFHAEVPHLNQMLDSLFSAPASTTSSTFTLPTSTVISTVSANATSSSPTHLFAQCSPLPLSLHLLRLFHCSHMMLLPLLPIYNSSPPQDI